MMGAGERSSCLALVAMAAALATGCDHRWHVEGPQPALYLGTQPAARTSVFLAIVLHDMYLPRWVHLANTAHFVVVSPDRVRFRVRLVHRWQTMTDVEGWRAWLEDDTGRRLEPVAVDRRRSRPITTLVVPGVGRDRGFVYRYAIELYDGGGDYVFYARDIYHRDLRSLALVLHRRGYEFRYTWTFAGGRERDRRRSPTRAHDGARFRLRIADSVPADLP
jgi:hypothetical protein